MNGPPPLSLPASRLCRNCSKSQLVILNEVKNLERINNLQDRDSSAKASE